MAFWNRKEKRALSSGLANPSGWMFDSLVSTRSTAGPRVTVDKALGIAPVLSAVSLIAEDVGQLPLKVYRSLGDGEREEARTHRSWRMLHDRPNAVTPAGRFWSTVAVHLLLYGNAFLEKTRDEAGIVDELWILSPNEVTVKWWPNVRQKTFVHRPQELDRAARELDDDDLLHIMNLSLDGLVGLSVIEAARTALGVAIARDEFEGDFYRNGAVLSAVVEMEKGLSEQALKRFATTFRHLYAGEGRRHGIPVLEENAKLRTVGSPLRDLEFVASQNMTRTDVAVMFKLPPNKLGGSTGDGLTYSTVEMNQTAIAVDAIAPLTKTIADALSQDPSLMPQNVHWAEFTLEGMLRADAEARATFYEKLVGMKAMHPDEVRKRENLPPLTNAQRNDLNPPPPVAPPLQDEQESPQLGGSGSNGNGNGAMPAITRS